MIRHFLIGGGFGLGLWLMARGLFPPPATLAERLSRHATFGIDFDGTTKLRSMWSRLAMVLLKASRGDSIDEVERDTAVAATTVEAHAIQKLNAGAGGGALLVTIGVMFGLIGSAIAITAVLLLGFALAYFLPDRELKKKAAVRREEFAESLNAFVGLVAMSISGGGGINSAMQDATTIGGGWCFQALRRSLDEAALHGQSPWAAFDELGRRFDVVPLIELAGALSLAGTSGARVTETLKARAESGRRRELTEAVTTAEKKSESMNIPVATMLLGWIGFMGYPAVTNLLGV